MRTRMRPAVTVLFVGILTLLLLGIVPLAGAAKQQVCHRTGSTSNRYVGIEPSTNAKGHDNNPHPGTNANPENDKRGDGWTKGPHQSSSACSQSVAPPPPPNGTIPNGGNPPCPPGDPLCPITTNGNGAAPPAQAIAGQPSVTG
jgi:hypothetical protein